MKKKRILGIVTAMLMVIALALTGCGQQGEQNAGATGSEGQNGTITDNDNANNGEATTEPEVNIGEKPDGSDAMALMAWYYKRDKSYIETVEKDTDAVYLYYWCYYARIGLLVCQRCNLAQEKPRTEFYGDTP